MCWVCSIIGLVLGLALSTLIMSLRSTSGTFQINDSNPEKDIYKLEIEDLDSLRNKRFIVFKVKNESQSRN